MFPVKEEDDGDSDAMSAYEDSQASEEADNQDNPEADPDKHDLHRADGIENEELSEEIRRLQSESHERNFIHRQDLLNHLQTEEDVGAFRQPRKDVEQYEHKRGSRRQSPMTRRSTMIADVIASDSIYEPSFDYVSAEEEANARMRRRLRVKTRDAKVDLVAEPSDEDSDEEEEDVKVHVGMTQQERDAAFQKLLTQYLGPSRKGKKRKQGTNVSIDLQTKIRIIEVAEQYQYDPKSSSRSKQDNGMTGQHGKEIVNGIRLAEQFGLNKSTVSRILKRKEEFKKAYYKDNISGCSKHINKKSKFDKLNRLVENWFDMNREKNGTITDTLIRDVGKRYAEELGISDFRGSNGWVRSLRNRKEHTTRLSVSIEDQEVEKRKKDNEAIDRMRNIFPNGVKDMAGFFKDLSTYLEKDGADMDEGMQREDDGVVAEEFLKKKMIDSLRIWSQELMASELSKLKKRMKPRQAAIL
eukprot:jgi/Phyca11/533633/estExt2_fgenesh1_pg.C_PHYCAscaffold_150127